MLNENVSQVTAGRIFARSVNYVAISKRARYNFRFRRKAYFSLEGVKEEKETSYNNQVDLFSSASRKKELLENV